MPDLPSGTVTFLFTDIEGSTRLLQQQGQRYGSLLTAYRDLLRSLFQSHTGQEVDTQGDSFLVVFDRALNAVAAAVAIQRALASHAWPEGVRMATRMGLHTGAPQLQGGGYVGIDVVRAARLMAAGHGGQVLLSQATYGLVRHELHEGMSLRELGEHRLKDLLHPERIFQLVIADLPADFPALKTLDSRRHNLPTQPTLLIGREREIAEVCALLCREDVRLVTLTGPGGTGKTRLALQVAAELLDDFGDGVWFVNLAPLSDPGLVARAIAQALGVPEVAQQPILDSLKQYVHKKRMLLVLDNFEQIVEAAPVVAELLLDTPGLKVLVTSRSTLHLYGEHEFAVPPLALPDPAQSLLAEQLTQYDAVRLFITRAQAAKADFAVTNANAPAVAEICYRLDGLPLAIELAAARVKLFPPQALLTRLKQRLKFLTGGARDVPERQQTIRGTIDWSYQLLEEGERALFRRLGVFVGGWALEAAEAVCNATQRVPGDLPLDVVDGLAALIDKSLVKQVEGIDGEPRFTMLETIHEYALEHLAASGELEVLRQRHAAFFVTLAEAGLPYQRQELEYPNLRAALEWSRTEADGTTELRLVVALDWRHSVSEARLWLAEALTPRDGGASWPDTAASRSLRAKALVMLGSIASWQNDLAAAQPALEESLVLFRELGDTWSIADALSGLGRVVALQGDYERSGALLEESLALFRQLENAQGIAECFFFMGNLAYIQGNLRRASECWQESLNLAGQLKNTWMVAISLLHLGIVALDQGDHGRAGAYLAESLILWRDLGWQWVAFHALEVCAGLALAQGSGRRAALLFGADEALRETIGLSILPIWHDNYQRGVAAARALLDEATFAAAWAAGRALTLEQAIAYALSTDDGAAECQ
jgi:predicted ATPase/class 3 adenylate cyclase